MVPREYFEQLAEEFIRQATHDLGVAIIISKFDSKVGCVYVPWILDEVVAAFGELEG